jgi:tRNA nucleotidyltransferase/poly(A) polymerase
MNPMQPPALVLSLAEGVKALGGTAYAVGGVVRDHLLHRPIYDWDIEVHAVPEAQLVSLLRRLGQVDAVGKAFAVFKLTKRGLTIDVSLPRRDSNAGPGHKGIDVIGDPFLGIREASRRRDLTLNAILCNLLTGELIDPFGGVDDLNNGILRAVDEQTFLEDPLRALRVVQFAARLNAKPTPALITLCKRAAVDELPAERIRGEWFKLLLADYPGVGLEVAQRANLLRRIFPGTPDDVGTTLDRLVSARDAEPHPGRKLALMLTAWLADVTAPEAILDILFIHKWLGYRLREAVLAAVEAIHKPSKADSDLRRLATLAEPFLALSVSHAQGTAAGTHPALARATDLGLRYEAEPPLLQGRDLFVLGAKPGPHMGAILAAVYNAQISGDVRTREQALVLAKSRLNA